MKLKPFETLLDANPSRQFLIQLPETTQEVVLRYRCQSIRFLWPDKAAHIAFWAFCERRGRFLLETAKKQLQARKLGVYAE